MLYTGLDIGSTTVKFVVLDENYNLLHKEYTRHFSQVKETVLRLLKNAMPTIGTEPITISITGSAGLGLAKNSHIDFVQEVFAERLSVEALLPSVDVVIELGGEDAKILFITGGSEERMNGTCAGGTGAFIDQMASLLNVTSDELNQMALTSENVYNIASRCGVFAKSDVQSLLNQGVKKEDIAVSILQAVVDQTITGLAQGRKIKGNVAFLGGPLTFISALQKRFVVTLKLDETTGVFPQDAEYYVALGAAIFSKNTQMKNIEACITAIEKSSENSDDIHYLPALFATPEEYEDFKIRHNSHIVSEADIAKYTGNAYLGIDAGSTTTKIVLLSENNDILFDFYHSNMGIPLEVIREQLIRLYNLCGDRVKIKKAAVTGYGEELMVKAFGIDYGIVETVAHSKAASFFDPNVDVILDIGGQDMKCIKLKDGVVDSIILNEACSSGCGSFIETFARAVGKTAAEFADLAVVGERPVDLGSRCTVFMNSSVKQAQKDGASINDISAGLAMSVVKNALYKVIRATTPDEIGKNIVVQGGTFYNDAILRSMELEIGRDVTRPNIAGLMGAFGCALYAKEMAIGSTNLLDANALASFSHEVKNTVCGLCTNHCKLTINRFSTGERYVLGNKCSRPLGKDKGSALPNAFTFKRERIAEMSTKKVAGGKKIGIPLGLNMYENYSFWFAFFTELGFEVIISPESDRNMYLTGQQTIPSDTVCYPAKLIHGHIEWLLEQNVDIIFYPCMPYNFDEERGDNNYNCPVVAYYPELLKANVADLEKVDFIIDYFAPHLRAEFTKNIAKLMKQKFGIGKKAVAVAVDKAYAAYDQYWADLSAWGENAICYAREHNKQIIVLAGRPYHADAEVNHGIDKMISGFDFVVLSEDSLPLSRLKVQRGVLNQWTYHSRLYAAADVVGENDDMNMIQLVSFGCGLDAVTTDEVASILNSHGKVYTQIKIDEINDLGAARIRVRSLIATIGKGR